MAAQLRVAAAQRLSSNSTRRRRRRTTCRKSHFKTAATRRRRAARAATCSARRRNSRTHTKARSRRPPVTSVDKAAALANSPIAAVGGVGRARAPKLAKQMKSLSLDCADAPPPFRVAVGPRMQRQASNETPENASSGEPSARSSAANSPRRLQPAAAAATAVTQPSNEQKSERDGGGKIAYCNASTRLQQAKFIL